VWLARQWINQKTEKCMTQVRHVIDGREIDSLDAGRFESINPWARQSCNPWARQS
jgi:hypothetical protein